MKLFLKSLLKETRLWKFYQRKKAIAQGRAVDLKVLRDRLHSFSLNGLNECLRKPALIVSLTSFPERIYEVPFTVYSLLTQTCKPDFLLLWLSYEEFPDGEKSLPDDLLKMTQHGLTIKWTHNLYSYNKIIPTLREYPDSIVVTADDDVFYPPNWLYMLYNAYSNSIYSNTAYAHRMTKITCDENGMPKPYLQWKSACRDAIPSPLNFGTGVGGILYPPNCFCSDVTREDIFLKLAPKADDLWLWAMLTLNNNFCVSFNGSLTNLISINPLRDCGIIEGRRLYNDNCIHKKNDVQLKNIITYYPKLIDILKNAPM